MNVSLSLVVTNIFDSFSFITLVMVSSALCSCAEGSQVPSLGVPALPFAPLPPLGLAADAAFDFSALFASTAPMHHCSKNARISKICLCCSVSVSPSCCSWWTISASAPRLLMTRSKIFPRDVAGMNEACLDESVSRMLPQQIVVFYYKRTSKGTVGCLGCFLV